MYEGGFGVQHDSLQAFEWYYKAAAGGNARNGAWRGSRQDEREAPGCLSGFGFAVKLSAGPEGAPPAGGRCPGLGERDPTLSIIALYLRTTIS